MDIDKQVLKLFSDFVVSLSKTFPEIKNCLYRNYECEIVNTTLQLDNCPKITKFLEVVHRCKDLISKKDETFFEKHGDEILEEISFERLWTKNITPKCKEILWKYFQTFSIITINLKSGKELQEAFQQIDSGSQLSKDKVKELKQLKSLSKEVKKDVNQNQNQYKDLKLEDVLKQFGMEGTGIGEIAKEAAETLGFEEMAQKGQRGESNPMEMMADLMSEGKIEKMTEDINKIVKSKLSSGKLKENDLKSEAEKLKGDLDQNDIFKTLMQQMGGNLNQMNQNK
tara:strand:+ start:3832 stop:4680 length:849 start_codon:yes stop_codon:yes gene_type:complete